MKAIAIICLMSLVMSSAAMAGEVQSFTLHGAGSSNGSSSNIYPTLNNATPDNPRPVDAYVWGSDQKRSGTLNNATLSNPRPVEEYVWGPDEKKNGAVNNQMPSNPVISDTQMPERRYDTATMNNPMPSNPMQGR